MINYKLREYIEKGLDYRILNDVQGVNKYNGKEFISNDMSFKDVKFVMKALANVSTWESIMVVFGRCFNVTDNLERWFYKGNVVEFYEARNSIIKEFNKLIKQEQQLLKSIETVDTILWKQAGGDRLNRFGAVIPLNQLGKLYGIFPFELQEQKYMDILILLTLEKETAQVESKYNKLKQKR